MMDYQLEDTVFLPFTTRAFATGIPTVLAGTPAIDIYEDATATPIVTGETLVVSLNSVVGFNMITVTATAATGFNVGGHYTAVIQAGTVASVSVVGEVVAEFTIDNSAAAKDLANGTDGLTALKTGIDDVPTVSEFNARTLVAADYFDPAADAVANVTLVATTTTNTDMRGTDSALLAASINLTAGAVDNVTLVATTTTNTDMRGTDSALLAASAPTNFGDMAITITTGRVSVGTSFDKTGYSISGTITTLDGLNDVAATDIVSSGAITTSGGAVSTVTTLTGHTAQTGDSFARIGAAGASLTDLGGMSTGMKGEVNTEMLDVMNADTITLPGQGAPAAAPTHREAIAWIYKNFRNRKVQSATLWELYDDAGTVVDAKATVSDDGTDAEKAEIVTGP